MPIRPAMRCSLIQENTKVVFTFLPTTPKVTQNLQGETILHTPIIPMIMVKRSN